MRKITEPILRTVIQQRLQAGLPFQRVVPPFVILRRDGESPNWTVHSSDVGLMQVVRDLQSEFELEAP